MQRPQLTVLLWGPQSQFNSTSSSWEAMICLSQTGSSHHMEGQTHLSRFISRSAQVPSTSYVFALVPSPCQTKIETVQWC